MSAGNIFGALDALVQAFEDLGVRYQIGGSVASSAYGIARATLDVDLVADLGADQIHPFIDLIHILLFVKSVQIHAIIK